MAKPLDPVIAAQIVALIRRDLSEACDDADLQARLARNGYGIDRTDIGRVLVTLPHRVELFALSAV